MVASSTAIDGIVGSDRDLFMKSRFGLVAVMVAVFQRCSFGSAFFGAVTPDEGPFSLFIFIFSRAWRMVKSWLAALYPFIVERSQRINEKRKREGIPKKADIKNKATKLTSKERQNEDKHAIFTTLRVTEFKVNSYDKYNKVKGKNVL